MRKASLLTLIPFILIAAGMLAPTPVKAQQTALEIPAVTPQPEPGEEFNITINVVDVTDLNAFGISLVWNADICEYTGTVGEPPAVIDKIWLKMFTGQSIVGPFIEKISNTEGTIVGYGVGLMAGQTTFNGTGALIIVEFRAKALGLIGLNFTDPPPPASPTGIEDSQGQLIPHDRIVAEIPVVPEFPAYLLMPLFLTATIIAVVLAKTVWSKRPRGRVDAK